MTRARPYKSNDNAHVEQKNRAVVRREAFHYRHDTAVELQLLGELYPLVRIRLNMFTATAKAIGWRSRAQEIAVEYAEFALRILAVDRSR